MNYHLLKYYDHGKLFRVLVTILLITLTSVSGLSQENGFSGPNEEDSFFPIAWSDDGTVFAYGWFETTQTISNGSRMVIMIQDLITDKVLYENMKTWDEGNVGEGNNGFYPTSAQEAWKLVADKINKKFVEFDIRESKGAGISSFPTDSEEVINIKFMELEEEPGYGVFAYSEKLGEKVIYYDAENFTADLSVVGYVFNPDETRIAVIMNTRSFLPYSNYWIIGCHVNKGFEKN